MLFGAIICSIVLFFVGMLLLDIGERRVRKNVERNYEDEKHFGQKLSEQNYTAWSKACDMCRRHKYCVQLMMSEGKYFTVKKYKSYATALLQAKKIEGPTRVVPEWLEDK